MFRDVPGLPFAADGVSPDVITAGEPRLRRYSTRDAAAPERARVRRRLPLARLLRPVSP